MHVEVDGMALREIVSETGGYEEEGRTINTNEAIASKPAP
jgi:hypothetical protein